MKLGFRNNNVATLFLLGSIMIWCLSSSCSLFVEGVDVFNISKHPFANQMEISDIPQFITITFDDNISPLVVNLFRELTEELRDPRNGCGIKTTFFLSFANPNNNNNDNLDQNVCELIHGLNKGHHEIATNTYNHTTNPTLEDITAAIDFLSLNCNIPRDELIGFRSPHLQWSKEIPLQQETLDNLSQLGSILYDSSMVVEDYIGSDYGRNHTWPFTLDSHNIETFLSMKEHNIHAPPPTTEEPVITGPNPGLWEIPMYPFYNIDNTINTRMDYHNQIDPTITMTAKIQDNFQRRYYGNRAPLGLYFHGSWLAANGDELKNWINFVLATYNDVYFVTNTELIDWMKNPVPKTQYQPTCENQIIDCLPPSGGSCVFGTFDSESCDCICNVPYCKDDETGACTTTECTTEEEEEENNPPNGNGGGGSSSSSSSQINIDRLNGKCCPGGYSGNRPYDECRKFYSCENGELKQLWYYLCGNDLLFDASQGTCLWGADVTCTISVDDADECGSLQETQSPTTAPSMSFSPSTQPTSSPTISPTLSLQPSLEPTQAPIYDYDAAEEYLSEKRELNVLALGVGIGVVCALGLFLFFGVYVHKQRKKNATAQGGQSS